MILLTGSTGFIGSFLCNFFNINNIQFKSTSRSDNSQPNNFKIDLNEHTDLHDLLKNTDVVIHTAAKAHAMDQLEPHHLNEYRKINTLATINLARQSIKSNVKKFIFLSTIKVNGEYTKVNECFSERSNPNPIGPYALSKYEAEEGLIKIFSNSKVELIILRIPLVYGPGVKGNLKSLAKAINFFLPLPFKSIQNKRSLLSIYNLADIILSIINHSGALRQLYLLSDNKAISLPELISSIGLSISRKPLLFYIPSSYLEFIFNAIGKNDQFKKLSENLQIDNSLIKKDLNWTQKYDLKNSLSVFVDPQNP
ncbi:NAD-dependent epimerase/dehydratase family protein [Gammaproteobacteria bacterium]|nr:NAD-dependent epimerase/dehydratase family protein [Gammaproteobacteria bacterium]